MNLLHFSDINQANTIASLLDYVRLIRLIRSRVTRPTSIDIVRYMLSW